MTLVKGMAPEANYGLAADAARAVGWDRTFTMGREWGEVVNHGNKLRFENSGSHVYETLKGKKDSSVRLSKNQ